MTACRMLCSRTAELAGSFKSEGMGDSHERKYQVWERELSPGGARLGNEISKWVAAPSDSANRIGKEQGKRSLTLIGQTGNDTIGWGPRFPRTPGWIIVFTRVYQGRSSSSILASSTRHRVKMLIAHAAINLGIMRSV